MSMWHIIPVGDLKEHEELSTCHCDPKVIVDGDSIIVVHGAYDGREAIEEFNDILNQSDRV